MQQPCFLFALMECLGQVVPQVFFVFQSYGEPEQGVGNAFLLYFFRVRSAWVWVMG